MTKRVRTAAARALSRTVSRQPAVAVHAPPVRMQAALLVLCGALVFANGLNAPFVIDDANSIETNDQIRSILPLSESLSPPRDTPVAGRPLVNFSFAINYAISGLTPQPYRVTNLAIHLLAGLLLFGIIRRTLTLAGTPEVLHAHAREAACAAALIWIIHPLQTEVVNYVTQRTTALMGLMYLLALYCSIRGREPRHRGWRVASVVACAAGMACKESMATAPVMLLLYDRVFAYASFREAFHARGRLYAALAATWLILAGLLATEPRSTVGFDTSVGVWTYLLNQFTVIVDYLRLTFLPRGLVIDYGVPRPLDLTDVAGPAIFVLALGAASLAALVRWPRAGYLGAWFFITLSPTSSFVPIATEVGAERRMYLPLAAIVVLVVCGALTAFAARHVRLRVAAAACAVVCVLLAAGTVLRNMEYRSRLSLAEATVERRPHGRALLRLGVLLLDAGRREEALDYFARAKEEDAVGSRFILGTEHLVAGRLEEGIRELTDFIRRNPDHANVVSAREMLGRAYHAQGDLDAARDQYEAILEVAPNHTVANAGMGDVLLAENRIAEALPHLELVAERRQGDVVVLGKLGTALMAVGRTSEAISTLNTAVVVDPNHAHARRMLGRALASAGRFDEAAVHLRAAVELAPDDDNARRDLERVRAALRRPRPEPGS